MNVKEVFGPELCQRLEFSEATYWSKLYSNRSSLKAFGSTIAGSFAGALPELDILAMNRVIGLGLDRRVTMRDIEDIIFFYKRTGSKRFFIQLSPYAHISLSELLQKKGFRHHNNWVKLLRQAEIPLPEVAGNCNVVPIGASEGESYGRIIHDSFDWNDDRLAELLSTSVGLPGYRHYLVKLGDKPIAAGAMHIMNDYASMAFAGTLPEYRGAGAQSLLLHTRISEAVQAGCKFIVSETGEEQADKPVASYRNMRRFGFEIAYLRQNWIFDF